MEFTRKIQNLKRGMPHFRFQQRGRVRRFFTLLLCAAMIVSGFPGSFFRAFASDEGSGYCFELKREFLSNALITAVAEGTTVDGELNFKGEYAQEYAELFDPDGTLYELRDFGLEKDVKRDRVLDLRVFARIEGDIPLDARYESDGSEAFTFLLLNRSDEEADVLIRVDERETETITVPPSSMIEAEEDEEQPGAAEPQTVKAQPGELYQADNIYQADDTYHADETDSRGFTGGTPSGGSSSSWSRPNTVTDADSAAEEDSAAVKDTDTAEDSGAEESSDTKENSDFEEDSGAADTPDQKDDPDTPDAEEGSTAGDEAHEGENSHTEEGSAEQDSSISSHETTILTAKPASASDASPSDASPSDASKIIDCDIYNPVRLGNHGAVALVAASEELGLTHLNQGSVTYTAEDDGIVVVVTAPEKALPEGAKLVVTRFDEESSEYYEAAESVDFDVPSEAISLSQSKSVYAGETDTNETNNGAADIRADYTDYYEEACTEAAGMVVMDISFMLDGEEVEPAESVFVSIDVSDILPEGVDELTTWHFPESDSGKDPVIVSSTCGPDGFSEFEIDSFSTFTITWHASGYSSTSISVTSYFDGVQRSDLGPANLYIGEDDEFIFDNTNGLLAVENYEISSAQIRITSGWTTNTYNLYSITAIYNWDRHTWSYTYRTTAGGTETTVNFSNATVSLYYVTIDSTYYPLHISGEDISKTGRLTAVYDYASDIDNFENLYYYKWYRTEDPDPTGDTKWEEMKGWIGATYPIYDDVSSYTFKVELYRISDDALIETSGTYNVPYYNDVRNGSFENTVNEHERTVQYTDNLHADMIWRTTGFGSLRGSGYAGQDIEIVRTTGHESEALSAYGVNHSADGDQFAELNCEYDGTLYQDILTNPEEDMSWSLAHMARSASSYGNGDTMCVIAMDASVADYEFTGPYETSQEALIMNLVSASGLTASRNAVTGPREFEYTFSDGSSSTVNLWLIRSSGGDWKYYSGSFNVPAGQYLTRFLFGAVDTQSGNRTEGNLLDDIHMSQVSEDANGLLNITKKLDGVAVGELIPANTFSYSICDSSGRELMTVSLPTEDAINMDTSSGAGSAWTVSVDVNTLEGSGQEGHDNLTIKETEPSDYFGDYRYLGTSYEVVYSDGREYTYPDPENPGYSPLEASGVMVSVEGHTDVTFTNAYEQHLTLEKVSVNDYGTVIDGAIFRISDEEDGTPLSFVVTTEYIEGDDGSVTERTVYTLADEDDLADNTKTIVESFTLGTAVFVGLESDAGDKPYYYYLTEVSPPDGYGRLGETIVFHISSGEIFINVNGEDGTFSDIARRPYNSEMTLQILNRPVVTIYKYAQDGESTVAALAGAEFILSRSATAEEGYPYVTEMYAQFGSDTGTGSDTGYSFTDWTGDKEVATHIVSGSDGYIRIENLSAGAYTLTEVKAPEGFLILEEPVEFTVNDDGTVSTGGEEVSVIMIANIRGGSALPDAGGQGALPFVLTGLLLVNISALICLAFKRKKAKAGI